MTLDDLLPESDNDVGECNHPYLRHDGAWTFPGLTEGSYTCMHPNKDVPQCGGSFLERRFNWDDWKAAFWHEDYQYFTRRKFNDDE